MSLPEHHRLSDAVLRDQLTPQDAAALEVYLSSHPKEQAAWEEEFALNRLLGQVPAPPVSSNFTARVLQAVRQLAHSGGAVYRPRWGSLVSRWIPQLTALSAALLIGAFSYHQHQVAGRREVARKLAEISRMSGGMPLDLLENFEAIERLNQVPRNVDRELIAALQ